MILTVLLLLQWSVQAFHNSPNVGPAISAKMAERTPSINAQAPQKFTVEASKTSLCSGETTTIILKGSEPGISYQLYKGGVPVSNSVRNGDGLYLYWENQGTGIYTVRTTGASGNVQMNNSVTVSSAGNTGSINISSDISPVGLCPGTPIRLTAYGGNGSYTWSNGQTGSSIVVTPPPGQTTSYTVTGSVQCGGTTTSNPFAIDVQPHLGNVSITTGPTDVCRGTSTSDYDAAADNANGYTWAISPTTAGDINSSGVVSWNQGFPSSGSETVTITAEATGSCGATKSKSVQVRVSAPPQTYTLEASDLSLCAGHTTTVFLDASETGVSYQLYRDNVKVGAAVSGDGPSLQWHGQGPGTYKVEATGSCGTVFMGNSVAISSIEVTGSISITSDISPVGLCPGTQITLTAHGGYGSNPVYTWSNGQTGESIVVTAPAGQTVLYTVEGPLQCGNTDNSSPFAIDVQPNLGNVSITAGPTDVCRGASTSDYDAAADNANGYTWAISPTTAGDINSSGVVSWNQGFPSSGSETVTITAEATGSCGATKSKSVQVTVSAPPQTYTLGAGNLTLCSGHTTTVSLSGSETGVSYQLYRDNVKVGATISSNGPSLQWQGQGPGTYKVEATGSCGTLFMGNDLTITGIPGLTAPTGNTDYSVCGDATTTLTLSPSNGANMVRWYTVESGGQLMGTDNLVVGPGTYYASSYYNGTTTQCESAQRTQVTVNGATEMVWYLDADGDGYGNGSVQGCTSPGPDYVTTIQGTGDDDYDDTDPLITNIAPSRFYVDGDGDTYGDPNNSVYRSERPSGYVSDNTDCDDTNADINPETKWYSDTVDGDGLGNPNDYLTQCEQPPGHVLDDTDLCPDQNDPTNQCVVEEPLSSDPADHNYVYSRTYQKDAAQMLAEDTIDQNNFAFFTPTEAVIQEITYFDGLGRPIQQIGIDQTPKDGLGNAHDIVTHMGYDGFGRMEKEWLPHTDVLSQLPLGHFHIEAEADTDTYYLDNYAGDMLANAPNPFSEKDFEASPLNRVERQAAPGKDWAMDGGHEIGFEYLTNTDSDDVRQFEVILNPSGNTYVPTLSEQSTNLEYTAGELYKNITKDENHSGTTKLHTTEEFTDKQGRVVLKRTYADVTNGDGSVSVAEAHDTYYVYDHYGNLTYVLPPKMEATTASLADINTRLGELGYQYVYDHRNRLVEKQLPGKDREYIVYNKLDQPILTQDAIQRGNSEWLFTKYDAHGRVAYTGKATITTSTERTDVQDDVDLETILWEDPSLSFGNGGIDVGYGNDAYPTSNIEVLTVNYYDDYSFDTANEPALPAMVFDERLDDRTKGLATGTKVKVLDDTAGPTAGNWITTVTRYNYQGNLIYSYSENEYLVTTDLVTTDIDFVGRPQKVRSAHTRNGTTLVTLDNFTYDHVGRLMTQTQCIGNEGLINDCSQSGGAGGVLENLPLTGTITTDQVATSGITVEAPATISGTVTLAIDPNANNAGSGGNGGSAPHEELIVDNTYDNLGQLVGKRVGGEATGTGLQTVDFAYNVRGWLKAINNVGSTDKLFNFRLMYNDAPTNPLYNGNIAAAQWRTANTEDNTLKGYAYTYDALNRLTAATDNTGKFNVTGITYDKNGNIGKLKRMGWTNASPSLAGNTGLGVMDDLTYAYRAHSNKLINVADDNASDAHGFVDVDGTGTEYGYDANGNMVRDLNKGIGTASTDGITYNHLNLPVSVTINKGSTNGTINYVYDATGVKLEKQASGTEDGNPVNSLTQYAGNYVYAGNASGTNLEFFNHPEGYVNVENGSYHYVYQYKDHLGNVRLSYSDADQNGTIEPVSFSGGEIIEESNYYPFGLEHKGYNNVINGTENNYQTFNNVEHNESLSLNIYETEWRHYDPAIARFNSIDLLTEEIPTITPYNFSFNNPILYNDPTGLFPDGPQYKASTFVGPDGKVIEHRDDGDPTVYYVGDPENWDGSKDNLPIVGFEDWRRDYKPGEEYTYYNPTQDPEYNGQYLIPSNAYDYSQEVIDGKFEQDWAYILYGNSGTMASRFREIFGRDRNADRNQGVVLEANIEMATAVVPVPKGTSGWIVRKIFNKLPPQLQAKFIKSIAKGVVPPTGNTGIIKLSASEIAEKGLKGYTHKLKILGKGGDLRIYGKMGDNGHIVFDKIMGH